MRDIMDAAGPVSDSDEHYLAGVGVQTPVVSMSGYPPVSARVHARATHPCRGAGRDEGRCMVFIPDGRFLCHFCTRTAQAKPIIKIGCPLCGGILNEPGHYESSRHFQRVGHDRSTMGAIARESR